MAKSSNGRVHLVMDTHTTHKMPVVKMWPLKHPHWRVHLTPACTFCLNKVECFFVLLTEHQLRRDLPRSVAESRASIEAFAGADNGGPKPFRWIKSAAAILASGKRVCLLNTRKTAWRTSGSGHSIFA